MPQFFKSHNIRSRVLLAFSILSLFVVAFVVMMVGKTGQIDRYLIEIDTYSMPRIRGLLDLGKSGADIEQTIHGFDNEDHDFGQMKDDLLRQIPVLDQKESNYQRLVRQDARQAAGIASLAAAVQQNKSDTKEVIMEVIRMINEGSVVEGFASKHLEFDEAQERFRMSLIEAREGEFRLMISSVKELNEDNRGTVQETLAFAAIFLIIVIFSGFFLYRSIVRPILRLKDAMMKFGQGQTNEIGGALSFDGEVGELATSFTFMAGKLKESQAKLQEQTVALAQRYEGMSQQNKDLQDTKKAMLAVLEDARELEEKLAQEKNNLQAILASMNEALFVVNKDMKILMINTAFERLMNRPREKILSQKITDIMPLNQGGVPMPIENRPGIITVKTGRPSSISIEDDVQYITPDGKKIAIAMQVAPLIKDSATVGAVVVTRDISREKQLDEAKTGFISVASHQLRTPLTSMRWFSEMLMNGDAGAITDEQKHFVERVYQGTDRMIALVNLLLQIARVEAGRLKVEPIPLDLKSTTQGVALTLRTNLENKKQKLEITCTPDPLPLIPADQEVIWQCIQNLLSNAARYGPENSTIFVSIIQKTDMMEYSVKDTGIGIPKEQQGRIFEKFFRAENALKAVPEGSGLGLSLVKSLVEGWGGKVWFETEENKGTTFYFTIPLVGMKAREGEVRLAV